ncbi:B12-binding domain-containing radical SAM protein [Neorhizobium sp. Rsf11]|uniref:B12-binding domain-containing radical SAM protein n=1 Tax=Neorhizobium phenanthreniclasticum TaxID=3157917 RepID=A0ABV0M6V2_9HYPH
MRRQARVLLVYPRFTGASFWNFREACTLIGARYPAPPLGLITIAAMLPQDWELRLIDRNVEELSDGDIDWADLVLTGGMLPQQVDVLHIIELAHAAGKPVAIGGPDATSSPELYASADFRVLGEAEDVIDAFVAAWSGGEKKGDFLAPKFKADVTRTPVPRFDLLKFSNYTFIGVQFSRGCPFTCEFCDIIELYGRVPRTKTATQILAELDALYTLGYRGHVDFVDDNLIGNKKAVKAFLPTLIEWQRARHYPFEFSTEASLNLADDKALLDLLAEAGFFTVFIGIESPDEEVLRATQKKQNTRRDIVASIDKIYAAGIVVIAGFILGFDDETPGSGGRMTALIEDASIPVSMVGLLYALPNTQLTTRLEKEGRLHSGHAVDMDDGSADQCVSGLNFATKRPRIDILRDYHRVVSAIYTPQAFFGRVSRVGRKLRVKHIKGGFNWGRTWVDTRRFLYFTVAATVKRPKFAGQMALMIARGLFSNPAALPHMFKMAILYAHLGPFSQYIGREISSQIGAIEEASRTVPDNAWEGELRPA